MRYAEKIRSSLPFTVRYLTLLDFARLTVCTGGGNLGDLYWPEIELRLGIVRDFPRKLSNTLP